MGYRRLYICTGETGRKCSETQVGDFRGCEMVVAIAFSFCGFVRFSNCKQIFTEAWESIVEIIILKT